MRPYYMQCISTTQTKLLIKMKIPTSLYPYSFVLVFAMFFFSACNPKTYDFQNNYDTSYDFEFVKDLKGNNLFVKLISHQEIIDNYRNRGKEKSALRWEEDEAKYNAAIIQAFKDNWDFCDVFFYNEELYFNTDEFPATDINGKKHIVELEREQILLGNFIEICPTTSVANASSGRNRSGQSALLLKKWPEDGSKGKKSLKIDAAGCLGKSNIKFLVIQMQRRLSRTYEGKAL